MRILKHSNKQLVRMVRSLTNENGLLRQVNVRLRKRLEKYEGPELAPGQLIQPATMEQIENVALTKERGVSSEKA